MRQIPLLITIAISIITASCNNSDKFKNEIKEIDTYVFKLDSVETLINGINFDSLVYMQKEASKNEATIKKHYAPDTIDMVFAEKLNFNKAVRKSLNAVLKNKSDMLIEITELKSQFTDLKKDISEGLYNIDQIKTYMLAETLDYSLLELSFKNFNTNQIKQKANFYYANPQIAEYATQLINELEN